MHGIQSKESGVQRLGENMQMHNGLLGTLYSEKHV